MRAMLVICLALVSGACAATHQRSINSSHATAGPPGVHWGRASCSRRGSSTLPARVSDRRQGGAVVLARAEAGSLLAYVADTDSRSVHVVSVDEQRELVRTRLDGAPREILILPDGRLAVTLSDTTHIDVLEPAADPSLPLAKLCEREVPAEPWGLALSPSDAELVVTSGWGSALTVIDAATFALERVVPLHRDPRGVVVDRSNVAFVSHLVGAKMSAVDLGARDAPKTIDLAVHKSTPRAQVLDMVGLRTGAQGYALAKVSLPTKGPEDEGRERILMPMVSVDPGDAERERAIYYGPPFDGVPKESPFVGVVDSRKKEAIGKYLLGMTDGHFTRECLLPRAAAVREKTASLFVTCYGIDAILELDAFAVDPFRAERRRVEVPPGPAGVDVDDASGRAVIFSQMGAAVTVLALDATAPPAVVALDYRPGPELAEVARGRQLFYRTDDVRISIDGLACSSCHMDGRDDAITWATPLGPRQTPMLAGRLKDTAPYGWEGARPTLHAYISNTIANLGGKGLSDGELGDLSAFLLTLKGPPEEERPSQGALVERGGELFMSGEQGCSSCHFGAASTDTMRHDLQGNRDPVDTPSLRFVRGTAPYFHDGRYPTLEKLLSDPKSPMGHSWSLPENDRVALAAYLRTL
jgi:hypothetical protein